MKPLALVLFAVLLFSFVPLVAMQSAHALSAITFTNETSIDSQNQQFMQVYENGTSSTVWLDANSTGYYFSDSWDGSTLTSLNSTLTNSTYLVDSHAHISPVDLSRYSIQFDGSTEYAQAANNGVFDVGVEDFWMAGMFKRTSDSGGIATIISKNNASFTGYSLFILSSDKLRISITDGSPVFVDSSASISTDVFYAWAVSADRSDLMTLYLYNLNTGTSEAQTVDISGVGSITTPTTFTVARYQGSAIEFLPALVDNLIPPQIGETLSQAQFLEFATTGAIDGNPFTSWYDMNDGMGTTLVDMAGSNDLPLFNTPTWSSDVTAASTSRPTIYVTGRDSDNSTNGVGKWNLADLSEVDDEFFASDVAPLDIAQSTSNLYSTAINGSDYGTLYDVSLTRSFGSYTETSILTGNSSTPAYAIMYDRSTQTAFEDLNAAQNTAAAELIQAGSGLIGKIANVVVIKLIKANSPTGNAEVGWLDSSGNVEASCGTIDVSTIATSATDYVFLCPDREIAENDRIGIKYNGGDGTNEIRVYRDANLLSNVVGQLYSGSWADFIGSQELVARIGYVDAEVAIVDGTPDTRYHFFTSGTNGDIRVIKRTGSTSLLATAMDHSTGEPFSVIQLDTGIIIQTATDTYFLDTDDDSITALHGNSFLSRPLQTFSISPAERDFNTNPSYLANATYAANIVPNTGATTRTGVFISNVTTGGSGTLSPFEPDRFYYATENDLAIYAGDGSNTWTIASLGTKEQVALTVYTEEVGIDLIENTTAILSEDVINLSCDNGNYLIEVQYFVVGSDADCNEWWAFDQSGAVSPRQVPYNETGEVVHADVTDAYTIRLSVATPDIYFLRTLYDAEVVDSGAFDSGGNRAQELLLNQCYIMQIEESTTGNTVQLGNICAGDINPITVNLGSIVLPSNWLGATWSHTIQRDFNNSTNPNANSTNNHVLFTFQKQEVPYSANVHVVDHPDLQYVTYDQWFNFTEISGTSVVNITGINSNQTLYFIVYDADTDAPVINAVSSGEGFDLGDQLGLSRLGLLAGISVAVIFPILVANLFPKSLAYFGIIVVGATIGIMQFFGFFDDIPMNEMFWPVAFAIIALGVAMGYKRS